MKRFVSIIMFIILTFLLTVSINAGAADFNRYVGEYFLPMEIGRHHFGESLVIKEITKNYIDFDYQSTFAGHAVVYTSEYAYFVEDHIAKGKGTWAYADTPDKTESIEFTITLDYDCIRLKTSLTDKETLFYLTKTGDFSKSRKENNSDAFSMVINGQYITVLDNVLSVSALGELYKTVKISDNVSWRFICDGYCVYYVKNGKDVYRLNLEDFENKYMFSEENIFLEDSYNNVYIAYTYMGNSEDPIESSVAVYNYTTGKKEFIENYSSDPMLYSSRVAYIEQRGDYSPVDLYVSDIDGKNKKFITSMALDYCLEGENIYYAEAVEDDYISPSFIVKRCDLYGNNVVELTGIIENKEYAIITPEYVQYTEYEIISNGKGGYNIGEDWIERRSYYSEIKTSEDVIKVMVNGKLLEFDQEPIIKNDRTLVPLRTVFEALDAKVIWHDATNVVTVEKDDTTIKFAIGESVLYKNDTKIQLDVPAIIVNERTLVPVRAISEALNCTVDWDGENNTVIISIN